MLLFGCWNFGFCCQIVVDGSVALSTLLSCQPTHSYGLVTYHSKFSNTKFRPLMRLSYQKLKTEANPEYHSVSEGMRSQDASSFRIRFSSWWHLHNFLQNCLPRCCLSLKVKLIVDFALSDCVVSCKQPLDVRWAVLFWNWVMKCFKHSETYFLCKFISHSFAHSTVVSLANEA